MLRTNTNGQCIATVKANEHRSAVGRTPPVILNHRGIVIADDLAHAAAFKALLSSLVVPGALAGISLRPSFSSFGEESIFTLADRNDDWPEANANRMAKCLLSTANRRNTYRLDIPYVADNKSEQDIATALLAYLTANVVMHNPFENEDDMRLLDVIQVQVTRR